VFLEFGCRLIEQRLDGKRGNEIYSIPAVGRVIFTNALLGLIDGEFQSFDDFPEWLLTTSRSGRVASRSPEAQVAVLSEHGEPGKLRPGSGCAR
jgi:hypothetical protein